MIFWNNFKATFFRELRQMFSRPIYIFGSVGIIAFCCVFFLTFFNEGLPQRLPIGIVDHDQSSISRRFAREINATQGVSVADYYSSYPEARQALQEGRIYGFLEIPDGLYSDLLAGRRPKVSFYVNSAYLVGGTLSYRQLLTMANLASGAYQREILRAKGLTDRQIMGMIQPILIDQHQIGNTVSSYGIYLVNLLLPGVLELVILMITVFAVGYELKMSTSRQWIDNAGGSVSAAIIGKLLPYTILFTLLGLCGNILLFRVMHYPINGCLGNMMLGTVLFVIATQAVGLFMIGLFPVLRDGVCFAALYGVLAFSFAGFTFPVESMPAWIQGLATLFPLRHYFLWYSKEAIFATGFAGWWPQAVALLIMILAPMTVYRRLRGAMINMDYPKM